MKEEKKKGIITYIICFSIIVFLIIFASIYLRKSNNKTKIETKIEEIKPVIKEVELSGYAIGYATSDNKPVIVVVDKKGKAHIISINDVIIKSERPTLMYTEISPLFFGSTKVELR